MQTACYKEAYAGFWVRLAAFVIDSAIAGAALLLVRLGMSGVMALLSGTALGGRLLFSYSLKDIALYLCDALYPILFLYFTGTTPGKRLMNLRVVRADGQEKLPLLPVVYRETVGKFLSGFVLGLGYLMIAIDKEKRGLHDFLSDTRVIYAKRVKVYPVAPKAPANPAGPSPQAPTTPSQAPVYGRYSPQGAGTQAAAPAAPQQPAAYGKYSPQAPGAPIPPPTPRQVPGDESCGPQEGTQAEQPPPVPAQAAADAGGSPLASSAASEESAPAQEKPEGETDQASDSGAT